MRESETIRRARQLKLGATTAEVEAIMGKAVRSWYSPTAIRFDGTRSSTTQVHVYATATEKFRIVCQSEFDHMLQWLGFDPRHAVMSWPVEVQFDPFGRVMWFRRGSEVVGR
jgi:hypothetical protein